MRTADCESSVRTDSAPYKWPLATAKDSSSGQIKHALKCDFLYQAFGLNPSGLTGD